MCRPQEFPASTSTDNVKLASKPSSSSRWSRTAGTIVALVAVGFPMFVSELIGGWTKQYTSPVMMPFGQLTIPSQSGKVVIVTGANTGIGWETSLELVRAGAHVIVACRNPNKAKTAIERIQATLGKEKDAQMTYLPLDLSSLQSVRAFATKFQQLQLPLDTLVLNAGVMKSPGAEFVAQELTYGFETTQDGLEYHIGVNHVAHFYLTQLLMDQLVDGGRIVAVSSMAEQGSYDTGFVFSDWIPANGQMPSNYEDGKAYGQSKLANLLFAKELQQRYPNKNFTAYSCHPGVIVTDLARYMDPVLEAGMQSKPLFERMIATGLQYWFATSFMQSQAGALNQLHLATADPASLEDGAFYHPVGRPVTPTHPQGSNETLQSLLWDETERVIEQLI